MFCKPASPSPVQTYVRFGLARPITVILTCPALVNKLEVIQNLLHPDPAQRRSMKEVLQLPWLQHLSRSATAFHTTSTAG